MITEFLRAGKARGIKKPRERIISTKKEARGEVKIKNKKGISYYLSKEEKNINIRERIENSWKTLTEIIFYSIVMLSIPFFVNNLQNSRLYYYVYIILLILFLISNVILLSIKEQTDKLILKK